MNRKVPDTKSIVLSSDLSSIKCKTFLLRPTQATDHNWRETRRTHPRNNLAIVQELVHNVCNARACFEWLIISFFRQQLVGQPCLRKRWPARADRGTLITGTLLAGQELSRRHRTLPSKCVDEKSFQHNTQAFRLQCSASKFMSQSHICYNVKYLLPGKQEDMQSIGLHLQNINQLKLRNQISFCVTRVTYLHKD